MLTFAQFSCQDTGIKRTKYSMLASYLYWMLACCDCMSGMLSLVLRLSYSVVLDKWQILEILTFCWHEIVRFWSINMLAIIYWLICWLIVHTPTRCMFLFNMLFSRRKSRSSVLPIRTALRQTVSWGTLLRETQRYGTHSSHAHPGT